MCCVLRDRQVLDVWIWGSSCLACDLKPSKHTFMEETFSGSQFKRIQFTMPGKVWWWEAVAFDHIWAGQEAEKRGMFK